MNHVSIETVSGNTSIRLSDVSAVTHTVESKYLKKHAILDIHMSNGTIFTTKPMSVEEAILFQKQVWSGER
jgi:hypothetical protein